MIDKAKWSERLIARAISTQLLNLPKIKKTKYGNIKVEEDGHKFDSRKEHKRYCELKVLAKAGIIKDLRLQVVFELIPAQQGGLRSERSMTYVADFVYFDNEKGREITEDAKGVKTKDYIIKRKLMKLAGREIVEV